MTSLERTPDTGRELFPWWATDPKAASPARRAAMALLNLWHAVTRAGPERRYERRILRRMARGDLTNTLGVQIRDEAHVRDVSEQWLAMLVERGLRPDDLCVEYGCGSLWCAEPAIRYLRPGRFIGLDATHRFYDLGRLRLGRLLRDKQVRLAVISRRSLREVAALKPAFVYSHRVLHHVPRAALARYVRSFASILDQRTIAVIENTRDAPGAEGRYSAADIQQYLPPNWHCRQEPYGLLITYRAAPAV